MKIQSVARNTTYQRKGHLALAVLLASLSLAACGQKQQNTEKPAAEQPAKQASGATAGAQSTPTAESRIKLSPEEARTAGLKIQTVQIEDIKDQLRVTATIQPDQNRLAKVAPLIQGRLTRVSANLGDQVKPGQVLATVNSVEAGQAHAAYQQAQSELALAQANFAREGRLYKQEIVAQKDYLKARAELQQAQANLRATRERLQTYGAGRGSGSLIPVRAPIKGTVIEKDAVTGELAGPSKPLFTVADLSTLWIEADIYEKDLGRVQVGAPAAVSVAAYPNETFQGHVTYISPSMNPETRTVKARVEVENPEGRLKPSMFATAAIETAERKQVLQVPADAVVLLQGLPSVFVAEDGGYEARAVQTGEQADGQIVIRSGLRPGERVVVSGAYALKAQMLKSQIGGEE